MNDIDFSDAALVVLGHGTTLNDQSAEPVLQHVAELRRRRLFREVHPAFWKQSPRVQQVLAQISAPRIFIAPLFISEGYFSTEIIPAELGFHFPDRLALRTTASLRYYCRPVGSHPNMTKVILARARGVTERFPFPRVPKASETTLFIAGHGTERNTMSRQAIERQVELIRALAIYPAVFPIFMEETPRISDCYSMTSTKNMVIVPFFISDGLHVAEDIPVLLGEPERLVKERLASGQPTWRNPMEKNGKMVWYAPSVGTEPLLADVILQRAQESAIVCATTPVR